MDFDTPPTEPLPLLEAWLDEAWQRSGVPNPNAMMLATVDGEGRPSARTVLLKGLDARGAVFFTNRESRKAKDIAVSPNVALLFHWDAMERQIRIEGSVSHTSDDESDTYFATRSRGSRIGAWASKQSRPAADRAEIDDAVRVIEKRFAEGDVPRPPFWGGYRVSFDRIEFWQGGGFRLHDRVVYEPAAGGGWVTRRLYP